MTDIKEKLIHFVQIQDNNTKMWPKIEKMGNPNYKIPYYYPEKK